jgi:hypothetical protein
MQIEAEVVYKIRRWDMDSQKVVIAEVTLDQMIKEPTGLNMSDVGVVLLNQVRGRMGLAPLNEQLVSGNQDETKS